MGQRRIELAGRGREVFGQLAEGRDHRRIGRGHFFRGGGERERFDGGELRRPRERLVERHRNAAALVDADVDEIVGRKRRPADEAEQVDVGPQLRRFEAELFRELVEMDARLLARGRDDEQQAAQPFALVVGQRLVRFFRRLHGRRRRRARGRMGSLFEPFL